MALVGGGGSVRSREGKQRSEGEGGPESEGEVRGGRGGAWRHRGVEEEAGGGRGGIGARHRAASVQGEEEDKGEEVGWAG